ncbi:MAG: putative DNA-binding domain-containing protein [Methylococcales bacterium]
MAIDFKAKQQEFAGHIKDAVNNPAPADVQPERMDMYRQLFFNNIDSFLSNNFPVLRKILTDQQWTALAEDFFARHRCHTPYFSEIPEEFLDYLQNERDTSQDYPFLLELAHYEWVEMALAIAKSEAPLRQADPADLLKQTVRLSPVAWPLVYQYPVHRIGPDFLPEQASDPATFLIVYRNPDDEVHFLEITPITYRLLEIIQEHDDGVVTKTCLSQLAAELPGIKPELIFSNGLQILADLADKSVIAHC